MCKIVEMGGGGNLPGHGMEEAHSSEVGIRKWVSCLSQIIFLGKVKL